MKVKLYLSIFAAALFLAPSLSFAQGCVAVKNMSSCPFGVDSTFSKGLQLSLNYRYFRSYKHFVGTHEETHRVEQGTEVINNDNSINLGITYTISPKWSASVVVPYIFIDRSSMYEHLGNAYPGQTPPNVNNPEFKRFHTQSTGIGDVRVLAYYSPMGGHHSKTMLNFGFGFKLPTGKYDATDVFHKPEGLVEGVVDQSIQRGDGGLGTILEVDFSQAFSDKFGAYVNGMYMVNPRNTNGVKRSPNLTKTAGGEDIALSNEFSVTDQYLVRAGGRFIAGGLQAFLGGRMECIPSRDLIGESDGFRRPGYIISIEPAAFYTFGQHTVGFNFPIALERNRTRSQIDKDRGINPTTNQPYHGDAAFADWLLSVTYAYRISM